jgi:hypothetical protein
MMPRLVPEIAFDTSRSALLEFYYNGATKQRELLVTNTVPIPYGVDVADGTGAVIGNAADIIRAGFDHWLPLIKQLDVLAGAERTRRCTTYCSQASLHSGSAIGREPPESRGSATRQGAHSRAPAAASPAD